MYSSFFNGSDLRIVVESASISHISVDWITGNIYWLVKAQFYLFFSIFSREISSIFFFEDYSRKLADF